MKKILAMSLSSLLLLTACTESEMDHINKDTHNPPAEKVPAKFQLTDALTSTAYTTLGGAYAWYVGSYTEQLFGTGNNQMMKAELRNRAETAASTTFNNEWNGTYMNLINLRQMLQKTSEGGLNEDQLDVHAMSQVLFALEFETLTMLHGDIPYSEACIEGIMQPKIDKQEDIYKDVLARVDKAIDLLSGDAAGMNNAGSQDILFGGSTAKWLGFAYAVKAKILLDGAFRYPENYREALKAADDALAAGFQGASLAIFNGVDCDNSWAAYNWSRYYSGANKTTFDLFDERQDPRAELYTAGDMGADIPYAPAGDKAMAQLTESVNYCAWWDNGAATIDYISLAELLFIKAECEARTNADASATLAQAIAASFDDYASASDADGIFDDFDIAAYAAGRPSTLKEIMVQKYLMQARDQVLYTYNDIRRCMASGEEFVKLNNPNNNSGGQNQWPLRLPYGNSDVLSNPNVTAAFGEGNNAGNYLFTENIWLFGGSR